MGEAEQTKKTLATWLNSLLSSTSVTDLYFDLRNGHVLARALHRLSVNRDAWQYASLELDVDDDNSVDVSHLAKINRSLDFLRSRLHSRLLSHVRGLDLVQGEPRATRDAVFALVLIAHPQVEHQTHENSLEASERQAERFLLNYIRSSLASAPKNVLDNLENVDISDIRDCWRDELVLWTLLVNLRGDLFKYEDLAQITDRLQRLKFIFGQIESKLNVPSLLDPEDLVSSEVYDVRATMVYLMCLHKALPQHEIVDFEKSRSEDDQLVRTPTKALGHERPRTFTAFCSLCEEVLAWVLHVEDQLLAMGKVIKDDLETSQKQFDAYVDFVFKVDEERTAVKKVQQEGERLQQSDLAETEKQEVKVRCKLLLTRWSDFRRRALDRQQEMTDALMSLQQSRLDELIEWVKHMEDRMSKATEMGANVDEAGQALDSHLGRYQELKDKHSRLPAFTLIEPTSPSSPETASSTTSIPRQRGQYAFFEDQADALSRRWGVLYECMEERQRSLIAYKDTWVKFDSLKQQLLHHIEERDKELQGMERSPTEEQPRLLSQRDVVTAIDKAVRVGETSDVHKLEALAESLVEQAEMSGDSRAVRAINTNLEAVLERWEVFLVRLEAQKTRLSRCGLNLNLNNGCGSETSPKIEMGEGSLKRRRVDSSRRMHFEAQHQHANSALTSTYARLQSALSSVDVSDIAEEIEKCKQMELNAHSVLSLGTDLTAAIVAEQDYPDLYLKNIEAKISSLREILTKCQKMKTILEQKREYVESKDAFYEALESSKVLLADTRERLFPISDRHEELVKDRNVKRNLEEMKIEEVNKLRKLANAATLLPAALDDPSNCIKRDMYALFDSWESILADLDHLSSPYNRKGEQARNGHHFREHQEECQSGVQQSRLKEKELNGCDKIESLLSSQAEDLKKSIQEITLETNPSIYSSEFSELESELSGLTSWLSEVLSFLSSEEVADEEGTLTAQFRESNALLNDFETLSSAFEAVRDRTEALLQEKNQSHVDSEGKKVLKSGLDSLQSLWIEAIFKAKAKNKILSQAIENCQRKRTPSKRELSKGENDVVAFRAKVDKIEQEWTIIEAQAISSPDHLRSQMKVLQRVQEQIETVSKDLLMMGENEKSSALRQKLTSLQSRLEERQSSLKQGSFLYGELKTLLATWMDAVNRLERRLDRLCVGADAEEISEEIEDLETILKSHGEIREQKISELVLKLNETDTFTQLVENEVKEVEQRWRDVVAKACSRKSYLEGSMAVAQEWESKLVEVRAWLDEKDSFISFHIDNDDHDPQVDGDVDNDNKSFVINHVFCTEQQREDLLREFEDRENLLAALDEQVDAYRDSGRHEAATRLEDQLQFIHTKFQALEMRLELLQDESQSDYEPRLNRVRRQLNDIRRKISANWPDTFAQDDIMLKIDQTRCMLNALCDMEPEVQSVIEVGARMLHHGVMNRNGHSSRNNINGENAEESNSNHDDLESKIDSLREDFHRTLDQVEKSRCDLENLLKLSDRFHDSFSHIQFALSEIESNLEPTSPNRKSNGESSNFDKSKHSSVQKSLEDMKGIRDQIISLQSFEEEIRAYSLPLLTESFMSLLTKLQKNFANLTELLSRFKEQLGPEFVEIESCFNDKSQQFDKDKSSVGVNGAMEVNKNTKSISTEKSLLSTYEPRVLVKDGALRNNDNPQYINNGANDDEEIDTLPSTLDNLDANISLLSSTTNITTDDDEARADDDYNFDSNVVRTTPKSSDGMASLTSEQLLSSPKHAPATLPKPSQLTPVRTADKQRRLLSDLNEFVHSSDNLLLKVKDVTKTIESNIIKNSDVGLQLDLIDMEHKAMEAEVETLLSRGQTMLLLHKRANLNEDEKTINHKLQEITTSWQRLLLRISSQKASLQTDLKLEQEFRNDFDSLQDFVQKLKRQLGEDTKFTFISKLQISLKEKSCQLSGLQEMALKLRRKRSKVPEEMDLRKLADDFREVKLKAEQLIKSRSHEDAGTRKGNKQNSSILAKIDAVNEAIVAINRQLDTQVLSHKYFENLPLQQTALNTAKDALDRLRVHVRDVNACVERLETEAISVENFETIVGKSEALRAQWQQVQQRYANRHALFVQCTQKKDDYTEQLQVLSAWIDNARSVVVLCNNGSSKDKGENVSDESLLDVERGIAERDTSLHSLVSLSKELMHNSSAEERAAIKVDVAQVLAKWRELLVALQTHREKAKREALVNNIGFMRDWVHSAEEVLILPSTVSSVKDVEDFASVLRRLESELETRRHQMSKLQSEMHSIMRRGDNKDALENNVTGTEESLEKLSEDVDELDVRFRNLQQELPYQCRQLEETLRSVHAVNLDLQELEKQIGQVGNDKKGEMLANMDTLLSKWDTLNATKNNDMLEEVPSKEMFSLKEMEIRMEKMRQERNKLQKQMEKEAKKESLLSSEKDNAPEKFAKLRDDYDYIERKLSYMKIVSVPEGDVEALSKQAECIRDLRQELQSKATLVENHLRDVESLIKPNVESGFQSFVSRVQVAWPVLLEQSEAALNVVDNALANMRIFENDLDLVDQRLSVTEASLKKHKSQAKGSLKLVENELEQQEQLQQLASAVNLLEDNVTEINDQATRIGPLSTKLELRRSEIQRRLIALRRDIDTAHRAVLNVDRTVGQISYTSHLPSNWERRVTDAEHLPFFVNHSTKETQWTHPVLQQFLDSLKDTECIRYAAYRMAIKLRRIQRHLTLDEIDIDQVQEAFNKHGLQTMGHNGKMSVEDILQVLLTLYKNVTSHDQSDQTDLGDQADRCLSWLLFVHDSKRQGLMSPLSLISTLIILCRGNLTEKYLLLFKQASCQAFSLTKPQLVELVRECTKLPIALGEDEAFRADSEAVLESTAKSCFDVVQKRRDHSNSRMSDELLPKEFLYWMHCEPQLLLWLPLLHRLKVAESAVHKCKCRACNMSPIVGFRYHCLKCNSDLCAQCFLTLGPAPPCKASHPVQEHCTSTGRFVNIWNFGQRVRYSFRSEKKLRKSRERNIAYLPLNLSNSADKEYRETNEEMGETEEGDNEMEVTPNMRPRMVFASSILTDSSSQLRKEEDEHEAIARLCRRLSPEPVIAEEDKDDDAIKRLNVEHERLLAEYNALKSKVGEEESPRLKKMEDRALILEDHNHKLETQIKRLRALLPNEQLANRSFNENADDRPEDESSSLHLSDCAEAQRVLD